MKIVTTDQYSPEWWQAKKGIPSASNYDRIITPKTGKLSAQANAYIAELIGDLFDERLPDRAELAGTRAQQHGLDTEPEARRWYTFATEREVRQVGFCVTDCGRFGCSPDGLVNHDGGLELKCPQHKTQVSYLLAGGLPDEYKPQVHGTLLVTGRAWWDFLSYCPGLPPLLVRVTPDDYTLALAGALEAFWEGYQAALGKIKGMSGQ